MEYYYTTSNEDQDYPYSSQPCYNDYHNNYHYNNSSSYDHEYNYNNNINSQPSTVWGDLDVEAVPLRVPTYNHEYGGYYNNESLIRYDQSTQFQYRNPYEHFPAQSLVVYQYSNSYDHPHNGLPAKKGSNFLDPVSTTGFVISYSNTEPKPALELELAEFDLQNYRGGYSIEETYGKPLPPSHEICYPPSKLDPTPPPPPSTVREGGLNNFSKTLELKDEEEDQASEDEEDEEDDEEEDDDEEEEDEEEEENRGVMIVPPLLGKDDQEVSEAEDDEDEEEEEENRGVMIVPPLPGKDDQGVNEAEEEGEEEESSSEEEQESSKSDVGRVEEKDTKRQMIPPGYGLEAMDFCEGVFGGYFPCMRKRSNQGSGDQSNNSNDIISSSGNNQDFSSDCWNTTVDYLFGDPDPYARALPDPIYGYHRYYPQQPISGQFDYGVDHSLMDNSSYYNYGYNGGGYLQ